MEAITFSAFLLTMEYRSTCLCTSGKKLENLIISYVLEHCLTQFLELWFIKRFVKYVNWHVISIVLCLNFCGETSIFSTFH